MTEVEKILYRDKNGNMLGQCHVCKRQLVRHTTPISRIIPELESRQSVRNPLFCDVCDNLEFTARMKRLREKERKNNDKETESIF